MGEGPTKEKDLCLIGAVYGHSGLVLVDILSDIAAKCRSTCWSICRLSECRLSIGSALVGCQSCIDLCINPSSVNSRS